ncbi:MAG: hypothetical protein IH840_05545, partial [Candidatus Heimdallarchaeota archaeon]|nr:hypothetical protein [Candidatus Heimdallarchaeota archaeon]
SYRLVFLIAFSTGLWDLILLVVIVGLILLWQSNKFGNSDVRFRHPRPNIQRNPLRMRGHSGSGKKERLEMNYAAITGERGDNRETTYTSTPAAKPSMPDTNYEIPISERPAKEPPNLSKSKFCRVCGTEILLDGTYWGNCGTSVSTIR